jgi:hypothetical protein
MPKRIVSVVHALQLVHDGLVSNDPQRQSDAESVMSALIVHLRHRQAVLPEGVINHLDRLENRDQEAV